MQPDRVGIWVSFVLAAALMVVTAYAGVTIKRQQQQIAGALATIAKQNQSLDDTQDMMLGLIGADRRLKAAADELERACAPLLKGRPI